ncbi:MAG: MotA/TolQ/ExbB proton channel family protein [Culturomica sp.]|jgi:biopolymer transport protein ExbB|nr:MotA/TolQ/ExbB proton channel family protein [Culturomica sp.]
MHIFLIETTGISLWEMIVKGGWLMIPLFLLSVMAVYIICERYARIGKATRTGAGFTGRVLEVMRRDGKGAAMQECAQREAPVARVLLKGIRYAEIPAADLRMSMENAANAEMASLEKGLSTLGTIANIAPMIGFLGTVMGMIQAFYDMSMAGNNINISLLSNGIYTAMVTTVAGLSVGIVASLGYNALVGRINRIAVEMENASSEFIDALYDLKK